MERPTFLRVFLFATVLLGAAVDGCGSGVATCESICALPGAPASCAAACGTQETACASAGYGANFQAYLTCVGNVGSYADVQQAVDTTNPQLPAHDTTTLATACAAEAAALANECGSSPGAGSGTGTGYTSAGYNGYAPPGGTGTGTGTDSGSGSGSGPGSGTACEDLDACCATLPPASAAQCAPALSAGDAATCEAFLASIEAAGDCTDTVGVADAGPVAEDAGSGPGPTQVDAGTTLGPCALGGTCSAGYTCNLGPGQGPCGSGVELSCQNGVYVFEAFTCDNGAPGCGFGMAGAGGCAEMCSCANGFMTCAGNCPDGGLASP